jgi:hypothetical protein
MEDFIVEFMTAIDINAKWQVCQQYHGQMWNLKK